jgi:hypothetical protein
MTNRASHSEVTDHVTASGSQEEIGYGEEPTPEDLRWQGAAELLAPDKTLTRITANARGTVSTVAFVGTALTALGLVSTTALFGRSETRWIATLATGLALLSVISSIAFLALRLERVNVEDIEDVKRWYSRQFRFSYIAGIASWLLLAAVVCAAVAAGTAILTNAGTKDAAVNIQVFGTGADRSVKLDGTISGLDAGSVLATAVTAVAQAGCPEAVVLTIKSIAGQTGAVNLNSSAKVPSCNVAFRLDVTQNGGSLTSITLP